MNTHLKSKFWGKSFEFQPLGTQKFRFRDNDEVYEFQQPRTTAHNIIMGTTYVDHKGECVLENTSTGDKSIVTFKPLGMFSGKDKRGLVSALIQNSEGEAIYELYGKWCEALYYKPAGGKDSEGTLIWSMPETPPDWPSHYCFSDFAMQLNMIDDHLRKKLPPTDSRLRPDQRHLENGELEQANNEKRRLEEKQRRRLKQMKKDGEEYQPRYFVREEHEEDTMGNNVSYRYIRGYWKDRKLRRWDDMPDLFGEDSE